MSTTFLEPEMCSQAINLIKTGLICTSNYTQSIIQNFLCGYANHLKFATLLVLGRAQFVSNL